MDILIIHTRVLPLISASSAGKSLASDLTAKKTSRKLCVCVFFFSYGIGNEKGCKFGLCANVGFCVMLQRSQSHTRLVKRVFLRNDEQFLQLLLHLIRVIIMAVAKQSGTQNYPLSPLDTCKMK